MDYSVPEVTSAEREFYGENLILLEGAISEFLSGMGNDGGRRRGILKRTLKVRASDARP